MSQSVPHIRIRDVHGRPINASGEYVLYWMTAFRRTCWNFSLQRACEIAAELNRPLVVFEALRCDYRWASDRLHHFIIQGMADNAGRLSSTAACYFPYVERKPRAGNGLLAALAKRAAAVVSDDFPCFFLPRMMRAAAKRIPVRFELVDSNGILPMRAADKVFARAYDFRRFLQKNLRPHLDEFPAADPLSNWRLPRLDALAEDITRKWPAANVQELASDIAHLAELPIDHDVRIVETAGGMVAAEATLTHFVKDRLAKYTEDRNQPERAATSNLSPYLHFGHISAHQVFHDTASAAGWSPKQIAEKANGSSTGWWGADENVESFLDELITWRELGYNMCWQRVGYDDYESLPDWSKKTLADHARDKRDYTYTLEEFESAQTHDPLWNAAQRQLVTEGRIHNYLRMLWGKKVLEWSASPEDALEVLIELNNKYALDGRNPNSYSGIFWCLGRYDRAWGPERPIFGKVRYMSSENTARKVRVKQYLEKFGPT